MINSRKTFCYRITHRDNLAHILQYGIVNKNHINADPEFVAIGNPEIIDVRSMTPVDLEGYGCIGDYVPFYFTPRSIMLYNIVTGYYAPRVPHRSKEELVILRCLIGVLAQEERWFFTDGQANDKETRHYSNLIDLDKIDWECIQNSNFTKSDRNYDRQRRYQAEFLVYDSVSISSVESICVYSEAMRTWTLQKIEDAGKEMPVHVYTPYFFD